jgi:hypothetical protein|tara:strand:- start:766 stop:945 length:180 start_codon:yes stop_codon:yes gene_type:complete
MTQFSKGIKFLSTTSSENRDGMLKSHLDELDEGESVFLKSAIDYYEKRPDSMEMMTLGE